MQNHYRFFLLGNQYLHWSFSYKGFLNFEVDIEAYFVSKNIKTKQLHTGDLYVDEIIANINR